MDPVHSGGPWTGNQCFRVTQVEDARKEVTKVWVSVKMIGEKYEGSHGEHNE